MKHTTALALRALEAENVQRTNLFGPPPVNPFAQLRHLIGFTLGDLSNYAKVDRRALSRLEAGMYANPLPSVIDFWVRKGKATEGQLIDDYNDYQFAQRRRHTHYFGPGLEVNLLTAIHPLRQLRRSRPNLVTGLPSPVGLTSTCYALCVPLDTLQFFEKKFRLQQSVPKGLLNALNQTGYTRDQLTEFEQSYTTWRERYRPVTSS